MTDAAGTNLDQAPALADEQRLRLAEALFARVPAARQTWSDQAWREELLHRVGEVRRGEVELASWGDVRGVGRCAGRLATEATAATRESGVRLGDM